MGRPETRIRKTSKEFAIIFSKFTKKLRSIERNFVCLRLWIFLLKASIVSFQLSNLHYIKLTRTPHGVLVRVLEYLEYRPITFTRMFELRHNILSNVRADIGKYVVTWLKRSLESDRTLPGHNEDFIHQALFIPPCGWIWNFTIIRFRLSLPPEPSTLLGAGFSIAAIKPIVNFPTTFFHHLEQSIWSNELSHKWFITSSDQLWPIIWWRF